MDPPHPWGTWFEHTWIYTKWEYFHTSLSFSGWLVLENILNNVYKLSYILNYPPPPWKRMYPFNYKLEPPSFNNALPQVWLKLAQWFWRSPKCKTFTDVLIMTDRFCTNTDQKSSFGLRWILKKRSLQYKQCN